MFYVKLYIRESLRSSTCIKLVTELRKVLFRIEKFVVKSETVVINQSTFRYLIVSLYSKTEIWV